MNLLLNVVLLTILAGCFALIAFTIRGWHIRMHDGSDREMHFWDRAEN